MPAGVHDIELRQGAAWLAAAQGELSSARTQLEAVAVTAQAAGAAVFEILAHTDLARLGGAAQAVRRLVTLADRVKGAWPAAVAAFATALAADDGCDLDAEPVLATLTDREREVVELAAQGLSNRAIADRLFVSVRTVHTHLHRSYGKLGISDRDQLAIILRR